MRIRYAIPGIIVLLCLAACGVQSPQPVEGLRAFFGARIIDGTGRDPTNNAVLIVRDGRIEAVGPAEAVDIPDGAERVDVSGKTIIPGLINTHGHIGDTKGLETGHYSAENILAQLRLNARYGITTVNSLGGDGAEAVRLRDAQATPRLDRSRLFVAGTVVTGDTPDEARAMVDKNAAMRVDFIKFRVDDFLGRGKKMSPEVYQAVIEQAHRHQLPVAAHMVYLEDARGLLQAGVDYLAHSIRDKPVDDEFIGLLKEKKVYYCPTLMREVSTFVYEGTPEFFEDPFFLKEADPAVIEQLKDPERQKGIRNSKSAQWYKEALGTAMENLKKLADGGVKIAFGTDAGPPGRFQGYFEHKELELMAQAGLSPMQILVSATGDAASAINRDDIGTLEPGKWADFIVLTDNPLMDITYTRRIESVWIAGNRMEERMKGEG